MPIRRLDPADHRPHRRGRGDRAAGGGDQGTGRERARRRREHDRGRDRGRRAHGSSASSTTGAGMDAADLALTVERHATSKIPDGDLTAIATFGFRGEALPSIASVSRLEIRTRATGAPTGLKLVVEDGIKSAIEPCAAPVGARVEARDLFAATPGAAQVPQVRPVGSGGCGRHGQATRDGRAARALFVCNRHRLAFDWPAAGPGEAGFAERLRQALGDDFAVELDRARRAPRRRAAHRPRRPADLQPAERFPAVPVRQRAGGARQDARRRAARGLSRFPAPRPARGRRAFPRMRPARSRRQRPSGESRSALSRRRRRPRPCRWSGQAASGRGAASGDDHRRHGDDPRHAPAAALPRRLLSARWDWRASPAAPRLAEPAQASFAEFAPSAPRRPRRPTSATLPPRSARRGRRCTEPISSPRPRTESSLSISTRRTSASSTRSSSASATAARSSGRRC